MAYGGASPCNTGRQRCRRWPFAISEISQVILKGEVGRPGATLKPQQQKDEHVHVYCNIAILQYCRARFYVFMQAALLQQLCQGQ
jgi:hypothetical protein